MCVVDKLMFIARYVCTFALYYYHMSYLNSLKTLIISSKALVTGTGMLFQARGLILPGSSSTQGIGAFGPFIKPGFNIESVFSFRGF